MVKSGAVFSVLATHRGWPDNRQVTPTSKNKNTLRRAGKSTAGSSSATGECAMFFFDWTRRRWRREGQSAAVQRVVSFVRCFASYTTSMSLRLLGWVGRWLHTCMIDACSIHFSRGLSFIDHRTWFHGRAVDATTLLHLLTKKRGIGVFRWTYI